PNVLVILDNSGSMSDEVVTGDPYNPATTYGETSACQGQPCEANKVYRWRAVEQVWQGFINDAGTITCTSASTSLSTTGTYQGKLKTNGTCTGFLTASFAMGNYINWLAQAGGTRSKMEVAKEVLVDLLNSTYGVKFGLMVFNNVNGGRILGVGDSYGWNGYDAYVQDMDTVFTGATTNREALVNSVNNIVPNTWTPLAETLYEAMRYFKGDQTYFNGSYTYTSPIEYSCQKNYIILITDGLSTEDRNSVLQSICNNGDCDGDGFEPTNDPDKDYSFQGSDYLDDVAAYLYGNDLLTDSGADPRTTGKQNVITNTVGFGLAGQPSAEALLSETAYNGGGVYYSTGSTAGLSESLRQILSSIIEDNSSFVAPVVPVSPENRTFSGKRIYMGFFKPQADAFWLGNLKKYGLDEDGNIIDKNGDPATNSDGSIRDNAVSYWSTSADGADVDEGGAGALLETRVSGRNIYTYTGTSADLTDSTNAFSTGNAAITAATLNVADATEKDRLINYVHGYDAFDEDFNGVTTEKRDWILGDILHSKPLVVNYSTYTIADESSCSINKNVIFVGSNEGMLHAFSDCDGSELWAFAPPDHLAALLNTNGATHTYFVDSSPSAYIYDANNNGNIEPLNGDKVVLMFGERRGGGFYYALDVTDPASPSYMWRLGSTESPSGTSTDYSELAESWSEPVITTINTKISGVDTTRVVAIIGAGYDNIAEDAEPAATSTEGRGVYVVEVARLSSGVPVFSNSGYKVWGYTNADDSSLTRSIPSQLSVADLDGNGHADRIYAADVGGNIWRFDIGSDLTTAWTGRHIFETNPGADSSTGRKTFYKPSLTIEVGYELLFYGTGDREHPIDTSVVDRLYAVKDVGQSVPKDEADLTDATTTVSVDISG
ncbi:MAG: PilC/PilY family type IV pilus protein, partial [Deltaproteobacteria bacterium]|nr:PilC/PilY family type IV pilus protein [Deltaproteobacteria bacterium]